MAKNKPATKKAASMKPGSGNKSILSFLYVPIAINLLAIAGAAYYLVMTQANPVNERHQSELIHSIADQYENYVNNVLAQHNSLLDQVASSDEIKVRLNNADAAGLAETEQQIIDQIPEGLTAHIFPINRAEGRPESNPPLSHAGLDMIRRAEQGQNLVMEAHQNEGQAYLQSVRAVRNDSNKIIGTISISQSLIYLSNQLGGIDDTKGNLIFQQQFQGAPVQTLVSYGAKNNNEVITLQPSNPNWTLTFQPADELAYARVLSSQLFWIVFGLLAIITTALVYIAGQRLQQTLRQDANSFAKQVQNLLAGQGKATIEFEFAIFNTLAKSVNRMRMGRAANKGGSQLPPGRLDDPLANNPEEGEEFNVPMIDSDNDLLGMNNAAAIPNATSVDEGIFGSYDIRGIFGQSLTTDTALQIGLAVGSEAYDRGEQTVVVGRDGRLSSPELTKMLIQGLINSGRDVIDIGIVPTPVCYFACQHLKTSACIMVTGSHLPANHNGFKVVLGGNALLEEEIKGLYHRIENQNFLTGIGKTMTQDVSAAYLTLLTEDINVERPLKVVIDCGNSVVGNVAPALIKSIGCHVLPLFCDVDGKFPNHQPNPIEPKNLQDLTRTVVETRADLGIAFNGDGDCLGIVTNTGKIIHADRLLMLLAKQVVQASPGATVLFDVKCSRRLKNLIIGFGGKPVMGRTGHSFMKRKMKETNAALAGEMSGHIFYQDRWFGFDDALYAASRLIEILASQNETLDTLFAELPQDLSTPELTIGTSDERKFRVIEALQRHGQFSGGQVTDIDGVRVDFQDGWGLVRASNSAPKIVCLFEGDSEESLRKIQGLFKQQLLAVDSQLQIPF